MSSWLIGRTPNKGLHLTASSVRYAPAFGSSSGLALGGLSFLTYVTALVSAKSGDFPLSQAVGREC